MYKRSIEDPAGFWSDIASQFFWKQKWGTPVYSENFDIRKGRINIEVCYLLSPLPLLAFLCLLQLTLTFDFCLGISGSRAGSPTYATTVWMLTLRLETVRRLPSIGKGMSSVLTLVWLTTNSSTMFARFLFYLLHLLPSCNLQISCWISPFIYMLIACQLLERHWCSKGWCCFDLSTHARGAAHRYACLCSHWCCSLGIASL